MHQETEEKAPLFGKWRYWYWLVLAVLALEIVFFYLISKQTG